MRILFAILCILSLSMPALARELPPDGSALVLIRGDEESGPAFSGRGLRLITQVPEGFLALMDEGELATVRSWGRSVVVLDPRDDGSREYLIHFEHEHSHPLADPPAEAETLYQGENYRIMSIPAEILAEVPSCVPEVQRIFRRPLRFVRRPWNEPARDGDREADPVIVSMVADIGSAAELQALVQTLQDFGTRHSEYTGGNLASQWIRDEFLSYGYTDVSFHDYNSWNDNVVCVKSGTAFPDEYVIIGGHYDSTSSNNANAPGADDNATGTVGVLELARVMMDAEFERSVIFIAFSGEEQGLVGSEAWASDAADAGMNVVGMINLDMEAYRSDAADVDVISNASSQPLRDMVFEAVATYVPGYAAIDGYLTAGTSDHASFWGNGYRAVFLFEDSDHYSPYIHSSNDVVGLSAHDFDFMRQNLQTAAAASAMLARPFTIAIQHDPLGHSEGNGPFELLAIVQAAGQVDVSSLQLHYRSNGGAFTSLQLQATGGPNEFSATIPPLSPGSLVEYYLSAADTEGNTAVHPDGAPAALHSFRTGIDRVFAEDCESDQGWSLGQSGDDASTGVWIRANPVGTSYQPEDDHSPDPGSLCFVTGNANPGDSDGANDVDGGRTTLLSPVFDLEGASWASISYWRWYTDETSHDDDFYVDISNDGGNSWTELELVPDSAYPWVKAEFDDLGSRMILTSQMRLRFIAVDENSGSLVEALIDDLEIVAYLNETAADEAPAMAARLEVFPNPFNPRAELRFYLPESGLATVHLYDAGGRELRRLLDGPMEAGEHRLALNADGLASGVYFVKLLAENVAISQKVVIAK